jgi:fructose-1-phosphate kinase PfkB-like protein
VITAVALSPAMDVTYVVDVLVEGRTHRPTVVERHPGGKAVNLARAAVLLGAQARVVAPLTETDAATFRSGLDEDGVDLVVVPSSHPLRMCVSVASRASARMTEIYEHAPPLAEAEAAAVAAAPLEATDGWTALSGSVPPTALAAVDALLDGAPRVAVDTHGASLEAAVRAGPAVVKVNRSEAVALLGQAPLVELVAGLHARSGGLAVVTDSTAGVAATDGTSTWLLRLPDVVGSFSQGSGDSMLGGVITALEAGANTLDALRLGVGAATANAMVPGAGRFDPGFARQLAERVSATAV